MEEWKDIPGYEGKYQISNFGNIRGKKLLKPYGFNPYAKIDLCRNGQRETHRIHRLVAITWISNPENLDIVNHEDENKLNNHVHNLKWMSQQENVRYGTAIARRIESYKRRKHGSIV